MPTQPPARQPDDIPVSTPRAWQVAVADLSRPGTLCVLLGDGVARITSSSCQVAESTPADRSPTPLRLPLERLFGAGHGADSSGRKVNVNASSPIGLSSTEQRSGSTSPWRAPTRPVTITAGTSLSQA